MSTSTNPADKKKGDGIKKAAFILLAFLIVLLIGSLPAATKAMSRSAWLYLGIFCGMLILFFTKAMPTWAAALTAMCLIVIFKIAKLSDTFVTFGQSTVWLLIGIFGMSVGLNNSGFFKRLALKILSKFPKNYKGQVLALFVTSLVSCPLIPSSAAKASLLLPIGTEVSESVGIKPRSKEALGIFTAAFLPSYFLSSAFLSGSVYVSLMLGFIKDRTFSWLGWLAVSWPWFVVGAVLTYLFCVTVCKPKGTLQELPADFISKKLEELGPMSRKEKQGLVIFVLALLFWLTQSLHGIGSGIVALLALVAMMALGLMDTKEFGAKVPWGTIVFVGCLLSISSFMSTTKAGAWIGTLIGPLIAPIASSPWILVPALCIITFIMRFAIDQLVWVAIVMAIFTPFMAQYHISAFVIVFVSFISGMVWNVVWQNPAVVGIEKVAGDKYVTYEDSRLVSVLFMVICLIGMTVSIPVWQALGLC